MNDLRISRPPRRSRSLIPHSALAALVLLFSTSTLAEGQDLPAADDLIDRYVELIGGAELFHASGSETEGTIEMPAMGLEGSFRALQAPPDQLMMRIHFEGLGEILQGYDGSVGWSMNPMTGPALMEGAELDQTRELAVVGATLRDPSVVPGQETIEETEYGGERCWLVRLSWASGRDSLDCYSTETGLLVATESTQASPMGEVSSTTLYQAYEDFDGRLLPTRLVQSAMGQEQVMQVRQVTYRDIAPEEFELPASIRTLVGDGSEGR